MKKTSGTGERTGRRGVRDLPPRRPAEIKGGWDVPVIETARSTSTGSSEFTIVHSIDKASPVLY